MKRYLSKTFIHFLLATAFALIAVFLSFYFTNHSGQSYDVQRIESVVQNREQWMDDFVEEVDSFLLDDSGFALRNEVLEKASANGIYLFVYFDDSLIAWSDNNLLPPNRIRNEGTHFVGEHSCYQLECIRRFGDYTYVSVFPVYNNYPFENEYLINRLNPDFGLMKSIELNSDNTGYPVHSIEGNYLFSVRFPEQLKLEGMHAIMIFVFYVLAFIYFIAFLYLFLEQRIRSKTWFLIVWIGIVLLFRMVMQVFQVPAVLYNSALFQPSTFAVNAIFPSLGDYFLHSLFTLFVVYVFFRKTDIQSYMFNGKSRNVRFLISLVLMGALLLITDVLFVSLRNLLLHSKINFDLIDPSNLNYLSIIGIVILILNSFIYMIVSIRLLRLIKVSEVKKLWIVLCFLLMLVIHYFTSDFFSGINELYHGFILLYFGALFIIPDKIRETRITSMLILFIIIAFGFNNVIVYLNEEIEHDHRKSLIRDLSLNQDPEAEYLFQQVENKIYNDSALVQLFQQEELDYSGIENYLLEQYFSPDKHWERYSFQMTICDQFVDLIVKPGNYTINCEEFFYNHLLEYGRLTDSKNLYYLEYGTGQTNYLGLFRFEMVFEGVLYEYTIYLEINSRLKREGYSKLLTESGLDPFEKIQNYSLARYQNNSLVESYGKYSYPDNSPVLRDTLDEYEFWDKKDYSHLTYRLDGEHLYVLSKKKATGVSRLVPFSYLFVSMILLVLLLTVLLNKAFGVYALRINYSSRLQLTIIFLLLIAFGIIAGVSVYYIQGLDESSNQQRIKELATSLQTEFEHKVQKEGSFSILTEDNMNSLAVKFSKVFNTDINLYTLSGKLLATTRNEVFDNALLSDNINPIAYNALTRESEIFFVHKESIGELEFYSAYLPFHDGDNNIVAYLNLPYFAKQNELRKEVSGFILTLINIYTLIIVLSILAALLISNYITRPLILIRNRMKEVQLGKSNEIIRWDRDDEIGQLVKEYNRMIGELAESAELLAKSERASAWREMAQQVAHEIKNPLTPMRMSIQFLQRAWEDQAEDREERLKKLLNTLIEQIDTLSDIATAFSDFAKMPKFRNEEADLMEIIHTSADVHKGVEGVTLHFDYQPGNTLPVWCDKKHMIRVFNNLIKNSIQAIDPDKEGHIHIEIEKLKEEYRILVRDNGKGIPDELREKIFVPNFTTKSSGTGLGLAMVKNIILSTGGTIEFESEEGVGTSFIICLPVYQNKQNEEGK